MSYVALFLGAACYACEGASSLPKLDGEQSKCVSHDEQFCAPCSAPRLIAMWKSVACQPVLLKDLEFLLLGCKLFISLLRFRGSGRREGFQQVPKQYLNSIL